MGVGCGIGVGVGFSSATQVINWHLVPGQHLSPIRGKQPPPAWVQAAGGTGVGIGSKVGTGDIVGVTITGLAVGTGVKVAAGTRVGVGTTPFFSSQVNHWHSKPLQQRSLKKIRQGSPF